MTRRFGRHNITGSEAHEPRPIAYMRKGFVVRRSRRRPWPLWILLTVVAMIVAVVFL